MALYLVGVAFLAETYKSQNIAVATAIFVIINIVTLALVSWFFFGEKLSAQQMAGIGLAIGAIVLLR